MTILIHLDNAVSAFRPTERQIHGLRSMLPQKEEEYEIVTAAGEREFLERLPAADCAVVWRFPAEWYARGPRLRHVCTPAAGRELVALDPSGSVSTHFGSFHGPIMAESLLAMMLFMKRRLGHAVEAQRARRWDRTPYASTRPLVGDVALIVGFGNVGRHCARLLRSLGVTVHGLRRHLDGAERSERGAGAGDAEAERMFGAPELLDAVALADHVVCIVPSDTGTDGLIGRAAFDRMKATTCVYNLGRGNAIAAGALCDALRAGKIQGAFLDVLPEEPLPESSPLWDAPNLYFTPHVSAARSDYLDLYFAELAAFLAGDRP